MILSRYNLKNINPAVVSIPEDTLFDLPEKVLQFGTGVLLRGLPDYFIDKANRQGIFNGRIVVVKSTAHGDASAFDRQDGLYTICVRGIANGMKAEENIINASISRVLNAAEQWEQVLECAHNQHLQVIISNTTEVGIQLVNDDIRHHPPKSYPGKLLAFLLERFKAFNGSEKSGLVIIPTELIPDNGKKLESVVLELAHLNGLDDEFIEWVECCNHFCSSLVDRIVPGRPDETVQQQLETTLGYSDQLLTMAEHYRLWAIEGGDAIREILTFAQADEGVVITPDINLHRELKLRLLNGTHTFTCGLAYLAGCNTVQQAMTDDLVSGFISRLVHQEIVPAIPYAVEEQAAREFAAKVLDRFRNPHIRHQWISITMNYSSKMKMRCIPLLLQHYQVSDNVPDHMALGFAAFLLFMRPTIKRGDQFYGEANGSTYLIQDEMAETFYRRWTGLSQAHLVQEVLADSGFWGADLHDLPGFREAVVHQLNMLMEHGVADALQLINSKKVEAA